MKLDIMKNALMSANADTLARTRVKALKAQRDTLVNEIVHGNGGLEETEQLEKVNQKLRHHLQHTKGPQQ